MMSGNSPETLFSLELLVEHIRLEKDSKVPDRLAVGVRLLDFPTLLIDQRRPRSVDSNPPASKQLDGRREFAFNRGKSCFFKMNLDSLHVHLSSTPLYAMVLDVTEEGSPRLVGSSLISLAEAMDRIQLLSTPSAHSGKRVVSICNLSREKIGTISLSYKLVCLGASLLPHIMERRGYERLRSPGRQDQDHCKEKNQGSMWSPTGNKSEVSIQSKAPGDSKILLDENGEDADAESQIKNTFEEDLTIFCPPYLYYSNTKEAKSENTEQAYELLNLDTDAFTSEDSFCEAGEVKKKAGDSVSKGVTQATKTSSSQDTRRVTTNVLREALQQLPLLNALVAELSQLTDHPNPAQMTKNSPQTQSLHNITQLSDPNLNHLPPPRNCSTPVVSPVKVRHNQKATFTPRKPQRKKKLTYGTTKTFNLRLKQISTLKVNSRECTELLKGGKQSSRAKENETLGPKTVKPHKRGFLSNRSSNLDENMTQSVTAESALKTVTQQGTQDRGAHGLSEDVHPQLKHIPIPSAHSDRFPQFKDQFKHDRESDQSDSQSDGPVPHLTLRLSSRSNSPVAFSGSTDTENDANYADDFDSLESSNSSSPEPQKSLEPSRARRPKSPFSPESYFSNSGSECFQKRPVHRPDPARPLKSPRRPLMGTHIIQPSNHSSALSFHSDADNCNELQRSSSQTACSGKPPNAADKREQRSSAESVLLSRSEEENSTRNENRIRESSSSFEAQEVEELEDELESLDFRKEYKHVSELVASKLPGYTM